MSGAAPGPVLVTGYWNVFLDGPVGTAQGAEYVRDSSALTLQVNAVLAHEAASAGAVYVDLRGPFLAATGGSSDDEGPLLASDGDHPSAQGHVVIAHALERALALHHLP
jgi:lysophospholipase L1-like esterase